MKINIENRYICKNKFTYNLQSIWLWLLSD